MTGDQITRSKYRIRWIEMAFARPCRVRTRTEGLGCRFANGLLMAGSGNGRQGAASSARGRRQLPLFAACCRVLPPGAGLGW